MDEFFSRKRNDDNVAETDTQLVSTTVSTKSVFQVHVYSVILDQLIILVKRHFYFSNIFFDMKGCGFIWAMPLYRILVQLWGAFSYFI